MTGSMVTGACGIAGENGREGVEELVIPDGELSKIDAFILTASSSVLLLSWMPS